MYSIFTVLRVVFSSEAPEVIRDWEHLKTAAWVYSHGAVIDAAGLVVEVGLTFRAQGSTCLLDVCSTALSGVPTDFAGHLPPPHPYPPPHIQQRPHMP